MAPGRDADPRLSDARAVGPRRTGRGGAGRGYGHRSLRLHTDPAADDRTSGPDPRRRRTSRHRKLCRLPRRCTVWRSFEPNGPVRRRVARIARHVGRHPGGNAVPCQHNRMACPPDGRRLRQRGGVRRRRQLDAGPPRRAFTAPAGLGLRRRRHRHRPVRCAGVDAAGDRGLAGRHGGSASLSAAVLSASHGRCPGLASGRDCRTRRAAGTHRRFNRRFAMLFASYTLEGIGYIIAGTFLVAAIKQNSPGWLGNGAWLFVGVAAAPSAALWAWLSARWSHPTLLVAALLLQAAGIALPAVAGGSAAALVGAVLFGGTFIGVSTMALAAGRLLAVPRRGRLADRGILRRSDPRPGRGGSAAAPRLPARTDRGRTGVVAAALAAGAAADPSAGVGTMRIGCGQPDAVIIDARSPTSARERIDDGAAPPRWSRRGARPATTSTTASGATTGRRTRSAGTGVVLALGVVEHRPAQPRTWSKNAGPVMPPSSMRTMRAPVSRGELLGVPIP